MSSHVGPEYGVRRELGVFLGNRGWEYWIIYFNSKSQEIKSEARPPKSKHHEELVKYMN
jgi:hypothetical protein